MIPLSVSSLISACRFSSQFWMYGLLRTRRGRPVKITVRTLSSKPAVRTASWWAFEAPASSDSTKRVPIQTAEAPSMRAAARDWPLNKPPAATTYQMVRCHTSNPISIHCYLYRLTCEWAPRICAHFGYLLRHKVSDNELTEFLVNVEKGLRSG
jgi:hypothetical protein